MYVDFLQVECSKEGLYAGALGRLSEKKSEDYEAQNHA